MAQARQQATISAISTNRIELQASEVAAELVQFRKAAGLREWDRESELKPQAKLWAMAFREAGVTVAELPGMFARALVERSRQVVAGETHRAPGVQDVLACRVVEVAPVSPVAFEDYLQQEAERETAKADAESALAAMSDSERQALFAEIETEIIEKFSRAKGWTAEVMAETVRATALKRVGNYAKI